VPAVAAAAAVHNKPEVSNVAQGAVLRPVNMAYQLRGSYLIVVVTFGTWQVV
jgi:hypothetical protein